MNPRNRNTNAFIAFALLGAIEGKNPEELVEEMFAQMTQPRPSMEEMLEEFQRRQAAKAEAA